MGLELANRIELTLFVVLGCQCAGLMHDQFHIRYAITENQPEDLRIGKLDEDLLQMSEIRSSELANVLQTHKYGLIRYQLREPSHYFHLHEASSILTTSVTIDLEALCPRFCRDGSPRAQLDLVVNIVHNNRVLAVLFVEVTVIDVDDNPPQFPITIPRPFVLQFKEVIYREGQKVELPRAVDRDVQPDHADVSYRLEAHPEDMSNALEVFHLLSHNDSRLMLVLQRDLDYEEIKAYRFYLVAASPRIIAQGHKEYLNAPQPNFEDRLEIRVEVLNINDIEPVFTQSLYIAKVSEDVEVGTTILTLDAKDQDENSTIYYSLEGSSDPTLKLPVRVESDGKVVVASNLDYEERAKYNIRVRASDGEFYALATIELTVEDVNDEAPDFVTNPTSLQVEENMPPQTSVGQVLIIDRDGPEVNGQVVCHEPQSVAGQQPLLFIPEPSEPASTLTRSSSRSVAHSVTNIENRIYMRFGIYTREQFDRELQPHIHKSLLVCSDGFDTKQFDQLQGHITRMRRLTSTLTISLTVRDQNDNSPSFEKSLYEADLRENCPIGTQVIQVYANDSDSELHAKPQYHLLQNELFGAHFEVHPETGWIITKANIDRETQALYQMSVLAIDGDQFASNRSGLFRSAAFNQPSVKHTATTHVNIRILDDNDNAPEFRGPRQFAVEENQPSHKWIGDLQVLDRDDGVNRDVHFELSRERAKDSYANTLVKGQTQMPQNTSHQDLPIALLRNGSLYTTETLDREKQSHYCFEVVAKDQSPSKSLSSTDTICVRVLDLNDNAPRFTNIKGSQAGTNNSTDMVENIQTSIVTIPISIHEAPGYCALMVEAIDDDEGRNGLLRFGLSDAKTKNGTTGTIANMPPNTFLMDAQSGRLMLSRNLHVSEVGVYEATLRVEDSGNPTLTAEKIVYLLIEDSVARGNWLFPETGDQTIGTYSGESIDSIHETHTILVVLGLSGVSAFLAAALISAILCMIKPCRRGNRRADRGRCIKRQNDLLTPNSKCSIENGNTCMDRENTYNDYGFGVLNGNGYAGSVDGRVNPRSLLITAAPIPGLDQLYLPSDKLIGVDSDLPTGSSINEECSWTVPTGCATLLSASPIDRLSSTIPLCHYTVARSTECNWTTSPIPKPIWTALPASIPENYGECPVLIDENQFSSLISPMSVVPADALDTAQSSLIPSHLHPVNVAGCAANFTHATVLTSPYKVCYTGCTIPTSSGDINGLVNSERHGSGEEQRSDSGRGASDEEVPTLFYASPFSPHAVAGATGGKTQFRSVTLKNYHDNGNHVIRGLVFPSLPRINPMTQNTNEMRLTTFETLGVQENKVNDLPDKSLLQQPSIVRFPREPVT